MSQHFKDLIAWQKAMDLAEQIYRQPDSFQPARITDYLINFEGQRYRLRATSQKAKDGIQRRTFGIFSGQQRAPSRRSNPRC